MRKQPRATRLRRELVKYHCGSHVFRITTPSLPKVAKEREVAAQPDAMVFIGEAQHTDASNRRSQPCPRDRDRAAGIFRETPVLPVHAYACVCVHTCIYIHKIPKFKMGQAEGLLCGDSHHCLQSSNLDQNAQIHNNYASIAMADSISFH